MGLELALDLLAFDKSEGRCDGAESTDMIHVRTALVRLSLSIYIYIYGTFSFVEWPKK